MPDQGDAGHQYDGKRAVRTQFVDDAHRHAGLAGAAGQDELGAADVRGKVTECGALLAPEFGQLGRGLAQHCDAVRDGFVLHRGSRVGAFRCGSHVGCLSQLDQCVLPDDVGFAQRAFVPGRQLSGRDEPAFLEDPGLALPANFWMWVGVTLPLLRALHWMATRSPSVFSATRSMPSSCEGKSKAARPGHAA